MTVLDRDDLPVAAVPRRGVPQSQHGHVLLVSGQRVLEELFPGLSAALVESGATPLETGLDLRFYRYGLLWPTVPTGFEILAMSRPLLEHALRTRVAELPNVSVRAGVAVSGLLPAGPEWTAGPVGVRDAAIGGVRLDDGVELPADLVVDCSGRGSRSDRWLAALGLPAPGAVEVKIGVGYATRLLRRSPGEFPEGKALLLLPAPPREKCSGLILPIEGDRWLVSVGGWHGEFPGADPDEFRQHAEALPHPAVAQLLARAEPLTGVMAYQFPSSRRRSFELLPAPPGGYVALGDAICSFNPIYGQGMTCAALEARELGRVLDRHGGASQAMARDFYRAVAGVIAVPWRFAVGGDFAFPETVGPRPRGLALLNVYTRGVQRAAQVSVDVRRTFTGVQQLVMPPSALFSPRILAKVLRAAVGGRAA